MLVQNIKIIHQCQGGLHNFDICSVLVVCIIIDKLVSIVFIIMVASGGREVKCLPQTFIHILLISRKLHCITFF